MSKKKPVSSTEEIEASLAQENGQKHYVLRLYVAGMTARSTEAYTAIKAICEEHLAGHYDLEVIDLYLRPELAKEEQIIAAPTLVRKLPAPLRRLIGNLSAEDRVRVALDIQNK